LRTVYSSGGGACLIPLATHSVTPPNDRSKSFSSVSHTRAPPRTRHTRIGLVNIFRPTKPSYYCQTSVACRGLSTGARATGPTRARGPRQFAARPGPPADETVFIVVVAVCAHTSVARRERYNTVIRYYYYYYYCYTVIYSYTYCREFNNSASSTVEKFQKYEPMTIKRTIYEIKDPRCRTCRRRRDEHERK
jgi:hypothetical protein